MTDRTLLHEIVDALEEQGLNPDEYQLQREIDVEALEELVDSATRHTNLEIQFSVGEFCVIVTPSDVHVYKQ